MKFHPRRATPLLTALSALLALTTATPARAGEWTLRLEPTLMSASGHDQHVLNIHEISSGASPSQESISAVRLDTDSGLAWRSQLRYSTGRWSWGVDVTVFYTDQGTDDQVAAAGGAIDQVLFEVSGRSFASSDPSEVLFYGVLEDTSLQTWTADLYALRTITEGAGSSIQLQLGLRSADFDNDYRAVVGVEDVGGRRLDASSNYDRMMGPLVGFVGTARCGRSSFEGAIAQAVLLGSVELSSTAREFTGPLSAAFPVEAELPTMTSQIRFKAEEDVAIPVTDLRIGWTYRLTEWLGLGLTASASAWWDVPVPPGVIPAEDGLETLHESTIVFLGLSAAVELRF